MFYQTNYWYLLDHIFCTIIMSFDYFDLVSKTMMHDKKEN